MEKKEKSAREHAHFSVHITPSVFRYPHRLISNLHVLVCFFAYSRQGTQHLVEGWGGGGGGGESTALEYCKRNTALSNSKTAPSIS